MEKIGCVTSSDLFIMQLSIGDKVFHTRSTGLRVPATMISLLHGVDSSHAAASVHSSRGFFLSLYFHTESTSNLLKSPWNTKVAAL